MDQKQQPEVQIARLVFSDWWKNKRENYGRENFFGETRNADRENREKHFFPSFYLKMHPC